MPAPVESGLNAGQKESLAIVDFIFHIIDPDVDDPDDRVIYLDEVVLEERQKKFFLDRLRDIAEGTQFVFKEDAAFVREKTAALVGEPDNFNQLSRQVTEDFAGRHEGHMSAGVFVVAVVSYLAAPGDVKKLVLLVKMDRSPTFSYSHKTVQGRRIAKMTEIPNALNETKQAIQKSAVIDVSDHFAWNVLAFDRVQRPLLGQYFRAFLGVTERQVDSALTRLAFATVKHWADRLSSEAMPENEDAFGYRGRALNYLRDHDVFDTDSFIDTVVRDEDPTRKATLSAQLRENLVEKGVAGQQFTPRPESVQPRERKQVYETKEGVVIQFEGAKEAAGLSIEHAADGSAVISIHTTAVKLRTK